MESSSASHYGEYDLNGVESLDSSDYQTAHGGYDPVACNDVPDRVVPVDALRAFEREGVVGKPHHRYYSTLLYCR